MVSLFAHLALLAAIGLVCRAGPAFPDDNAPDRSAIGSPANLFLFPDSGGYCINTSTREPLWDEYYGGFYPNSKASCISDPSRSWVPPPRLAFRGDLTTITDKYVKERKVGEIDRWTPYKFEYLNDQFAMQPVDSSKKPRAVEDADGHIGVMFGDEGAEPDACFSLPNIGDYDSGNRAVFTLFETGNDIGLTNPESKGGPIRADYESNRGSSTDPERKAQIIFQEGDGQRGMNMWIGGGFLNMHIYNFPEMERPWTEGSIAPGVPPTKVRGSSSCPLDIFCAPWGFPNLQSNWYADYEGSPRALGWHPTCKEGSTLEFSGVSSNVGTCGGSSAQCIKCQDSMAVFNPADNWCYKCTPVGTNCCDTSLLPHTCDDLESNGCTHVTAYDQNGCVGGGDDGRYPSLKVEFKGICALGCSACEGTGADQCSSCSLEYFLDATTVGSCQPCPLGCGSCSDGSTCNADGCLQGFYYDSGSCIACSCANGYPRSDGCSASVSGEYCGQCFDGFYLNGNGCTACPFGCVRCDGRKCMECEGDMELVHGLCQARKCFDADKCFWLASSVSHTAGEVECQVWGGHLATITTEGHFDFVSNNFCNTGKGGFDICHVGLHADGCNNIDNCPTFYDGSSTNGIFQSWNGNDPDNNEPYTVMMRERYRSVEDEAMDFASSSTRTSVCSATLEQLLDDSAMTILAPGDSKFYSSRNPYSNNVRRTFLIQTTAPGYVLHVRFTRFEIDGFQGSCGGDYLTIRDGLLETDQPWGDDFLCGSTIPNFFPKKLGTELRIDFRTDGIASTSAGYILEVSSVFDWEQTWNPSHGFPDIDIYMEASAEGYYERNVCGVDLCTDNEDWTDRDGDGCDVYSAYPPFCGFEGYEDAIDNCCACGSGGESWSISCSAGLVVKSIDFASYGKPRGSCGSFQKYNYCHDESSIAVVEAVCLGQNGCTLDADSFGEPCDEWWEGWDLHVEATCWKPPPTACEDQNGVNDIPCQCGAEYCSPGSTCSNNACSVGFRGYTCQTWSKRNCRRGFRLREANKDSITLSEEECCIATTCAPGCSVCAVDGGCDPDGCESGFYFSPEDDGRCLSVGGSSCEDLAVMFLLDQSGSVSPFDWLRMLDFTHSLIKGFYGSGSRVGIFKYSNSYQIDYAVQLTSDLKKAAEQSLYMAQTGGGTSTAEGLLAVYDELKYLQNKILILVTDGLANSSPCDAAQTVRDGDPALDIAPTKIFAVGVAGANEAELTCIAGNSNQVYKVDYDDLPGVKAEILASVCQPVQATVPASVRCTGYSYEGLSPSQWSVENQCCVDIFYDQENNSDEPKWSAFYTHPVEPNTKYSVGMILQTEGGSDQSCARTGEPDAFTTYQCINPNSPFWSPGGGALLNEENTFTPATHNVAFYIDGVKRAALQDIASIDEAQSAADWDRVVKNQCGAYSSSGDQNSCTANNNLDADPSLDRAWGSVSIAPLLGISGDGPGDTWYDTDIERVSIPAEVNSVGQDTPSERRTTSAGGRSIRHTPEKLYAHGSSGLVGCGSADMVYESPEFHRYNRKSHSQDETYAECMSANSLYRTLSGDDSSNIDNKFLHDLCTWRSKQHWDRGTWTNSHFDGKLFEFYYWNYDYDEDRGAYENGAAALGDVEAMSIDEYFRNKYSSSFPTVNIGGATSTAQKWKRPDEWVFFKLSIPTNIPAGSLLQISARKTLGSLLSGTGAELTVWARLREFPNPLITQADIVGPRTRPCPPCPDPGCDPCAEPRRNPDSTGTDPLYAPFDVPAGGTLTLSASDLVQSPKFDPVQVGTQTLWIAVSGGDVADSNSFVDGSPFPGGIEVTLDVAFTTPRVLNVATPEIINNVVTTEYFQYEQVWSYHDLSVTFTVTTPTDVGPFKVYANVGSTPAPPDPTCRQSSGNQCDYVHDYDSLGSEPAWDSAESYTASSSIHNVGPDTYTHTYTLQLVTPTGDALGIGERLIVALFMNPDNAPTLDLNINVVMQTDTPTLDAVTSLQGFPHAKLFDLYVTGKNFGPNPNVDGDTPGGLDLLVNDVTFPCDVSSTLTCDSDNCEFICRDFGLVAAGLVDFKVLSNGAESGVVTQLFDAPNILDSVNADTAPTSGNVPLTIEGSNFGIIKENAKVLVGASNCPVTTLTTLPGNAGTQRLICTLPPGQGEYLEITVTTFETTPGEQSDVLASTFSYDAPDFIDGDSCTAEVPVAPFPCYKASDDTPCSGPSKNADDAKIRLRGSNFGVLDSDISVLIGGASCVNVTIIQDHTIVECVYPDGASEANGVPVSIIVGGRVSPVVGAPRFCYEGPSITAFEPNSGARTDGTSDGTTPVVITLTGMNFGSEASRALYDTSTYVKMDGNQAVGTLVSWRDDEVKFQLGPGPGVGTVTFSLWVRGQDSGTSIDTTFTFDDPVITQLNPNTEQAAGGVPIVVTGTSFGLSGASVRVGVKACTPVTHAAGVIAHTEVSCILPQGTGSQDVTITVGGVESATIPFTYAAPSITGIAIHQVSGSNYQYGDQSTYTPVSTAGTVGSGFYLIVQGLNFGEITDNGRKVELGSGASAVTLSVWKGSSWFDDYIICEVPPGTGFDLDVSVSVAGNTNTWSSDFSYTAPSITGINVASPPDTDQDSIISILTINGENFGTSNVDIMVGQNPCVYYAGLTNTNEVVHCIIPSGIGLQQKVSVSVSGQSSGTVDLDYADPEVYSIAPTHGFAAGSQTLTVTGKNFGVSGDFAEVQVFLLGSGLSESDQRLPCVVDDASRTHTQLRCTTPPGIGTDYTVFVRARARRYDDSGVERNTIGWATIADNNSYDPTTDASDSDLDMTDTRVLWDYDRPILTGVSGDGCGFYPPAVNGITMGIKCMSNANLVLEGENFGASSDNGGNPFKPIVSVWHDSNSDSWALSCDGTNCVRNQPDSACLDYTGAVSQTCAAEVQGTWTDGSITFVIPEGLGALVAITVQVGGQYDQDTVDGSALSLISYAGPRIVPGSLCLGDGCINIADFAETEADFSRTPVFQSVRNDGSTVQLLVESPGDEISVHYGPSSDDLKWRCGGPGTRLACPSADCTVAGSYHIVNCAMQVSVGSGLAFRVVDRDASDNLKQASPRSDDTISFPSPTWKNSQIGLLDALGDTQNVQHPEQLKGGLTADLQGKGYYISLVAADVGDDPSLLTVSYGRNQVDENFNIASVLVTGDGTSFASRRLLADPLVDGTVTALDLTTGGSLIIPYLFQTVATEYTLLWSSDNHLDVRLVSDEDGVNSVERITSGSPFTASLSSMFIMVTECAPNCDECSVRGYGECDTCDPGYTLTASSPFTCTLNQCDDLALDVPNTGSDHGSTNWSPGTSVVDGFDTGTPISLVLLQSADSAFSCDTGYVVDTSVTVVCSTNNGAATFSGPICKGPKVSITAISVDSFSYVVQDPNPDWGVYWIVTDGGLATRTAAQIQAGEGRLGDDGACQGSTDSQVAGPSAVSICGAAADAGTTYNVFVAVQRGSDTASWDTDMTSFTVTNGATAMAVLESVFQITNSDFLFHYRVKDPDSTKEVFWNLYPGDLQADALKTAADVRADTGGSSDSLCSGSFTQISPRYDTVKVDCPAMSGETTATLFLTTTDDSSSPAAGALRIAFTIPGVHRVPLSLQVETSYSCSNLRFLGSGDTCAGTETECVGPQVTGAYVPFSRLVCLSQLGGDGVALGFTIDAMGQESSPSLDTYTYPDSYTLKSVQEVCTTSCKCVPTSSGLGVKDCPTDGDVLLRITLVSKEDGKFPADENEVQQLVIEVEDPSDDITGVACTGFVREGDFTGTCTLSEGAGTDLAVQIINPITQQSSNALELISYGAPEITDIFGCATDIAASHRTEDCARDGGDEITIFGNNFGPSNAFVLAGGSECAIGGHGADPHHTFTCRLTQGTGQFKRVIMLQAGQFNNFDAQAATFSYALCPEGSFQANALDYACTACGAGQYQDTPGALGSCRLCPAGKSQTQSNQANCVDCDAGTYSQPGCGFLTEDQCLTISTCSWNTATSNCDGDATGAIFCQQCEPGEFQSNLNSASCNECAAGFYSSSYGNATCAPCPSGRFADSEGTSECAPCDFGEFVSQPGATACEDCPRGRYQDQQGEAGCKPCLAGTAQTNTRQSSCDPCEAGKYAAVDSQSECTPCAAGYFANTTNLEGCYQCPPGSHQPDVGQEGCILCEVGTAQAAYGQPQCVACKDGSFANETGSTSCSLCSAGEYESGGTCVPCPRGKFSSSEGALDCDICPPGTFTNEEGQAECGPCPAGEFQDGFDNTGTPWSGINLPTACKSCPEGKFQGFVGQDACTDCDPGTYTNTTGEEKCVDCLSGEHTRGLYGETECEKCPEGKYATYPGTEECEDCLVGYAQPETGMATCTLCAPGKYQDDTGKPTCENCTVGWFAPFPGTVSCKKCGQGEYNTAPGLSTCESCMAGSYQDEAGQTGCDVCRRGTYSDQSGFSICTPCAPGTATNTENSTSCAPCGGGTFTADQGEFTCKDCPAGTAHNSEGKASCDPCLSGTYSDSDGELGCTECDPGTSTSGADKADNQGYTNCKPCVAGTFQSERGAAECQPCATGYFASGTRNQNCTACAPGSYGPSSAEGRECLFCEAGKFQSGSAQSSCEECAPGSFNQLTGLGYISECAAVSLEPDNIPLECQSSGEDSCDLALCSWCPTCSLCTSKTAICPGTECELCPAGKAKSTSGAGVCEECGPGKYTFQAGSTSCLECPKGTYNNETGQTECRSCAAGYSNSQLGAEECDPCPAGKYQTELRAEECEICVAGRFSDEVGRTRECGRCNPGSYQPSTAASTCLLCEPGQYQDGRGETACLPCAEGTAAADEGRDSPCDACVAGRFQPQTGAAVCEPCLPGTYQDLTRGLECKACTQGRASNDTARPTECPRCEPGTFQLSDGRAFCEPCGPGAYQSEPGSSECRKCALGTASNEDARGSPCEPCPAGTFQIKEGQEECDACAPGTFQVATGKQECDLCPRGKYANETGSEECRRCSAGTYQSREGQESCRECRANECRRLQPLDSIPPGLSFPQTGTFLTVNMDCDDVKLGIQTINELSDNGNNGLVTQFEWTVPGKDYSINITTADLEENRIYQDFKGEYQPSEGQPKCLYCLPGTYQTDFFSKTECKACLPGRALSGQGNYIPDPRGIFSVEHLNLDQYVDQPELHGTAVRLPSQGNITITLPVSGDEWLDDNGIPHVVVWHRMPNDWKDRPDGNGGWEFIDPDGDVYTSLPEGEAVAQEYITVNNPWWRSVTFDQELPCNPCARGESSPAGSERCLPCGAGRVAPDPGSPVCDECDVHAVANADSTACLCNKGWMTQYSREGGKDKRKCQKCELGMNCDEIGTTIEDLGLEEGYYRAGLTDTAPPAKCLRLFHCMPGRPAQNETEQACWDAQADVRDELGKSWLKSGTDCNCGGRITTYATGKNTVEACGSACEEDDRCKSFSVWKAGLTPGLCELFSSQCDETCLATDDDIPNAYYSLIDFDCSADPTMGIERALQMRAEQDLPFKNYWPQHCSANRRGPLCALCEEKFFEGPGGECLGCGTLDENAVWWVMLIFLAVIIACFALSWAVIRFGRTLFYAADLEDSANATGASTILRNSALQRLGRIARADELSITGPPPPPPDFTYKFKVAFGFFQIVAGLSGNMQLRWPTYFEPLLSAFDAVGAMDITKASLACSSGFGFYDRWMLMMMVPILVTTALFAVYYLPLRIRLMLNRARNTDSVLDSVLKKRMASRKFMRLLLFWLFAMYPVVSSYATRIWNCITVNDGEKDVRYLRADLAIECDNDVYTTWTSLSIPFILLYPFGIPAFFFIMLYRKRKTLSSWHTKAQLGFLYAGYHHHVWWWEMLDMLHKLILTSLLQFFSGQTTTVCQAGKEAYDIDGNCIATNDVSVAMPIGMVVAATYFLLLLLLRPYIRKGDDRLHQFAQAELLLLLMCAYTMEYNKYFILRYIDIALSAVLITALVVFLIFLAVQALTAVKKKRKFQKYHKDLDEGKDVESDYIKKQRKTNKKKGYWEAHSSTTLPLWIRSPPLHAGGSELLDSPKSDTSLEEGTGHVTQSPTSRLLARKKARAESAGATSPIARMRKKAEKKKGKEEQASLQTSQPRQVEQVELSTLTSSEGDWRARRKTASSVSEI